MHIVVCVKQVPNPDTPASQFRIDEAARRVEAIGGVPLIMSPFDEQAVEVALRLREAQPGIRITVLTLGPDGARNVLKHGLAMGADDGVLLNDSAFAGADSYATAVTLAAAIRKIGAVDLVLAGRQAADDDNGVVGTGIGELLGMAVICFAKEVSIRDAMIRVERVLDDGTETIEATLPAVVSVSNEIGEARKPSLRETMRAARKPITQWGAADVSIAVDTAGAAGARCSVERVYAPVKENRCELIAGETPGEQAAALVQRLRSAKLI